MLKLAQRFVGAMQVFNETTPNAKVAAIDNDVDEDVIRKFAIHAGAELQPMAAFLGGVVAQEVVKVGGKYTPIPGFLHFNAMETLPAEKV